MSIRFRCSLWRPLSMTGAGIAIIATSAAGASGTAATMTSTTAVARTATAGIPVKLSGYPLGVNVAPWDSRYAAQRPASLIQPRLKSAGVSMLHYGGGSFADFYDWQTNSDIRGCLPGHPASSFTAPCAHQHEYLDFTQFSRQARAIGAAGFVTVNYGSGTPKLAASWVRKARTTPGEHVALWEIGNESYGCWEVNNELAQPPERYPGYKPDYYVKVKGTRQNPTCPWNTQGSAKGTLTLARSYGANASAFAKAMKAADPAAVIGVPWAFDKQVKGAEVPYADEWNDTVLKTAGKYAGFVDLRYYPFGFSGATGKNGNPTDQQVLSALRKIPSLKQHIRSVLNAYDPKAGIVVGETGMSHQKTTAVCQPLGAVFAAGDILSWLAAGARSVQWWDLTDDGNKTSRCVRPDSGFFTSSAVPATETPYTGYLLAAKLARPGAKLAAVASGAPSDVLAFESSLPRGGHALAFININALTAKKVRVPIAVTGSVQALTYSAGNQDAAKTKVVSARRSARSIAGGITLPRESIMVLETR